MIVYESDVQGFREDVLSNRIEERILARFEAANRHKVSASEVTSWKNSLAHMDRVLSTGSIPVDAGVAVEFFIPGSTKRMDFVITGLGEGKQKTAIIVELKQWTTAKLTDKDAIVETALGSGIRETSHPSYQAWSYASLLVDFNEAVRETPIEIRPCAYLHNCESADVIRHEFYREHLLRAPAFLRDDAARLRSFISEHIKFGDKKSGIFEILNGRIRPSKNLADRLASLLKGNPEFTLIDDQKVVFETALKLAKKAQIGAKQVLIVEGGPGTGKTVVAVNLLVRLIEGRLNAKYITKNAAPRAVYEAKLKGDFKKSALSNLFGGPDSMHSLEPNTFDTLIIDEAHRLRAKSGIFGNLGENQVAESIRAARLSIFFVDDAQRVTLKDVGGIEEIRRFASKEGAEVTITKLESQFRCNGSDGYLGWIDHTLGVYVTTPQVSAEAATVAVKVTVANQGAAPTQAQVKTQLLFADNRVAEFPAQTLELPAGGSAVAAAEVALAKPKLWDTTTPNRYTAVTTVEVGGKVVDRYETVFGIRSIAFTPDKGFILNGQHVQLKGVCNHHDLGALGSAWNTRAAQRQLETLKEMGFNALRTSHNMPAPELLDLCDAMGIVVMDESFDCWRRTKTGSDYATLFNDWHEQDLRAEYRRDRNHPSVVMWSIGNELPELIIPEEGPALAAHLTAIAHDEDPTRPTTVGSDKGASSSNGVQNAVDVLGMNYQDFHHKKIGYAQFRIVNPTVPLVGSETASCFSSRGEYFFQSREQVAAQNAAAAAEAAKKGKPAPAPRPFEAVSSYRSEGKSDFQMSSYDLYAPGWATIPDVEFAALEKNPHVAGEFVWTGFDYLGEPTPYSEDTTNLLNFHDAEAKAQMEKELKEMGKIKVPSRSSYMGAIDLAGFKKDRFFIYQAHWRPDLPMAHLLPHWTWPERVGQPVPVHLYTSGDEAELFLNGRSLGRKKKAEYEYRIRWDDVIYAPGVLKVVAYKNGKQWATDVVKTAGPATALTLSADRSTVTADGKDLSFVTVRLCDRAGTLVPRSNNLVSFIVSGPGEVVATDNGDATSHASFQSSQIKAYNGLALAIIRATGPGKITVTAKTEGMGDTKVVIKGL